MYTTATASAITAEEAERACRALPLLLVSVKIGVRTAENVSVNDTTVPSEFFSFTTHVACAPTAPVHTSCMSNDTVTVSPGRVKMFTCDALKREESSAKVSDYNEVRKPHFMSDRR